MGLINLSRFILEEQRRHPEATGDFSLILEQIALAAKIISKDVSKAGIANILGESDSLNVFGERQQKLDLFAHNTLIYSLDHIGKLAGMVSEESDKIIEIPTKHVKGKYLAVFDPLDGSSNIDVNISIGTIFGIYKKINENIDGCTENDFLQSGEHLVCAGYVIYGASTMLVYSTGNGVNGFTLDPSLGEFILSHENMKIPYYGSIYSVNEAYYDKWDEKIKKYIDYLKNFKEREYKSRYIGSLVSDFHRNLLKGGIFLYPADKKNPSGKLRLLYEANPLSFIIEQAGGKSIDGKIDILRKKPQSMHERTPLFIGSPFEINLLKDFMSNN
jgi:fructose-1,6-bisphosphatase I